MCRVGVTSPLRILAVSALWQGANDYAFVRAFRRAGHSVRVVSDSEFFPLWRSRSLRALRRVLRGRLVWDYNAALIAEAEQFRPDLFFVFKGSYVTAETLQTLRSNGIICIQFYPDTGFGSHSPYLSAAICNYDWFFSTKPDHRERLKCTYGLETVSFLPHAFDPETHFPPHMTTRDIEQYGCDLSFIGNISEKKYRMVRHLTQTLSDLDIRIWGVPRWGQTDKRTATAYQGGPVLGFEYAKAINASRINLGLLFEGNADGAAPDEITARTFEIPAAGGFMLHEHTEEVMQYFEEGRECDFFSNPEELIAKIRYYLDHEDERRAIAAAGRQRCLQSSYSIDHRARAVIEKFHEIRAARSVTQAS
jgi:hypothetical protein